MTDFAMTDKDGFEIETCGRCGGSGQYSYNQRHGTKCYGCGGSGKKHTVRGVEARRFYEESLKVPAHTIKIGDLIQCERLSMNGETGARYFAPVTVIEEGGRVFVNGAEQPRGIVLNTESPKYGAYNYGTTPDDMIRRGWTGAEKAERLEAARAYQATLTKAGKPRKG